MCGLFIYICITTYSVVGVSGNLGFINAVYELQTQLQTNIKSLNSRIDQLEERVSVNELAGTGSYVTDSHDGEIKSVINDRELNREAFKSEKAFIRHSLSMYENDFGAFRKEITERYEKEFAAFQKEVINRYENEFQKFQKKFTNRYENEYQTLQDRITEQVVNLTDTFEDSKQLVCDDSCTKNGGECIRPGVCGNCPSTRHGPNCGLATRCTIPRDIDSQLSVYQIKHSSQLHLNKDDYIQDLDYVMFICSSVNGRIFVPSERRFQCVLGKWKVADYDTNWLLEEGDRMEPDYGTGWLLVDNTTREFPTCREAQCEPLCQNGGICVRDNECQCPNQYTGTHCQTLKCGLTDPKLTELSNATIPVYETDANKYAWPWMAQLEDERGRHFCVGSLISDQWVLTAALCLERASTLYLKKWKLQTNEEDTIIIPINGSSKYVHPNYNTSTNPRYAYNIGLIKLPLSVEISQELMPICLPNYDYQDGAIQPGTYGVVTGWGRRYSRRPIASTLQQMQMVIGNCSQEQEFDPDIMFCAGGKVLVAGRVRYVDACAGYSGAPYAIRTENDNNKFIQIGIVSHGYGCKRSETGGFYTKITKEMKQWINDIIQNESKCDVDLSCSDAKCPRV